MTRGLAAQVLHLVLEAKENNMYYKLKSSNKGFKLIGTCKRIGKQGDGYLYLTQEEIDKLSPDAIEGYEVPKEEKKPKSVYYYLNRP